MKTIINQSQKFAENENENTSHNVINLVVHNQNKLARSFVCHKYLNIQYETAKVIVYAIKIGINNFIKYIISISNRLCTSFRENIYAITKKLAICHTIFMYGFMKFVNLSDNKINLLKINGNTIKTSNATSGEGHQVVDVKQLEISAGKMLSIKQWVWVIVYWIKSKLNIFQALWLCNWGFRK